jgi:hypothetical protein
MYSFEITETQEFQVPAACTLQLHLESYGHEAASTQQTQQKTYNRIDVADSLSPKEQSETCYCIPLS